MSDKPTKQAAELPPYDEVVNAPIVYFDLCGANGVFNGAIMIELSARILTPMVSGGVATKFITTGRLRCSPMAAVALRDALNGSLQMIEQPQQAQTATNKLN
jgi:hypothetical protein